MSPRVVLVSILFNVSNAVRRSIVPVATPLFNAVFIVVTSTSFTLSRVRPERSATLANSVLPLNSISNISRPMFVVSPAGISPVASKSANASSIVSVTVSPAGISPVASKSANASSIVSVTVSPAGISPVASKSANASSIVSVTVSPAGISPVASKSANASSIVSVTVSPAGVCYTCGCSIKCVYCVCKWRSTFSFKIRNSICCTTKFSCSAYIICVNSFL
jgi:hypothetical protein